MGEGDSHLHGPTISIPLNPRIPNRIPGTVFSSVIVEVLVALDIGGTDTKGVAGAAIVVGIQGDLEIVEVPMVVPPHELVGDGTRIAFVEPGTHVESASIEEDPDLRLFLSRDPLHRFSLNEAGGHGSPVPGIFVQSAIDVDLGLDERGLYGGQGKGAPRRRSRRNSTEALGQDP